MVILFPVDLKIGYIIAKGFNKLSNIRGAQKMKYGFVFKPSIFNRMTLGFKILENLYDVIYEW